MAFDYSDNLAPYLRIVNRHRNIVVMSVLVGITISTIVSFLLPITYRAQSVIMPISGDKGAGLGGLMSQLGGLSLPLAGAGASKTMQLVAVLQSRTLVKRVATELELGKVFFPKSWNDKEALTNDSVEPNMDDLIRALSRSVNIFDDKKRGTIIVSSVFKDRALTANVANAYIKALQRIVSENAFTQSKRNRIFIEGQLAKNQADFLEAGKTISEFYRSGSFSNSQAKIDIPIDIKSSKNVMTFGPLDDSSSVELFGLSEEVDQKMVEDVPQQVYLQYLGLKKELLAKTNLLLAQQYEMAKIEEVKDDLSFQIVDIAEVPQKKYGPNRLSIVAVSALMSLIVACCFVIYKYRLS